MKNWLIIGSVAARHWFPDARDPSDIDLLTPLTFTGSKRDICIVETQWHDVAQFIIDRNVDSVFADPNVLFTLKVSHAEWDIKWEKTMFDVKFFKDHGCQLDEELYAKLIPVWKEIHGKKRVNMAQSMETFFSDAVKREYNHEDLHELVAFHEHPLHEELRPDHGTAWCDRTKFEAMDFERQCEVALEEIMATAIERFSLTVESKTVPILQAVHKVYFKLCTSMTTGWFAKFLILNRYELLFERREKWMIHLKTSLQNLQNLPKQT